MQNLQNQWTAYFRISKYERQRRKLEASRYCKEKIEKRNAHLKSCAPALWDYVMQQLDVAVEKRLAKSVTTQPDL